MGQFTETIDQLKDASDKDSNKEALFKFYNSLPDASTKAAFVKDLIDEFEECIEKAKYLYLTNYNEDQW